MILSAFSTLGLQGNEVISKFWLVKFGASNHMTNSIDILKNFHEYNGPTQIQVGNGSYLHITKVGDITKNFKKLSTSLISVGQFVDNNCNVKFSRNGCIVQDQVLGTIIAKGLKVGRLFPIHFAIPCSGFCFHHY